MSLAEDMQLAKQLREKLRSLDESISRRANRSPITADEERGMREMQSRADAAYQADGRRAPEYLPLERPLEYQRRLISGVKDHSPDWRKVDFNVVNDDALPIAAEQVFADALKNARYAGLRPGELRELPSESRAGHRTVEFAGASDAWFGRQFHREPRRAMFKSQEQYNQISRDGQMARVTEIVRTLRPPLQAPRAAF